MSLFYNRVMFTTLTSGTSDFGVGSRVTGYNTPAERSVPDGTQVTYTAESSDKTQWETGQGIYSTGTVTRATVRESSNGNAKVSFTASPTVWLDYGAQDIPSPITAGRLIGRGASSGNGAAEQIALGSGLSMSGTTLSASGGGGGSPGSPDTSLQYRLNATTFAGDANLQWLSTTMVLSLSSTSVVEWNADVAIGRVSGDAGLSFYANNATSERMRITSDGRIGFGTLASPPFRFQFQNTEFATLGSFVAMDDYQTGTGDGTNFTVLIRNFNNDGFGDGFLLDYARGTSGGPVIVQNGDLLGTDSFRGYDGSHFRVAAAIRGLSDGVPGINDMPGRLLLMTTPSGSNGPVERLRIDSAGFMTWTGQTSGSNIQFEDFGNVGIAWFSYNVGGGSYMSLNTARGTSGGILPVAVDDELCTWQGRGSRNTIGSYATAGSLQVFVDSGTVSTTSMPGRVVIKTTPDGSVSPVERLRIDNKGSVIINAAAISTSATDGFLYIPTCAGTPTGTPTSYSGRVPMVYDTTNNKFYIYNGGWKGGTNPGAFT